MLWSADRNELCTVLAWLSAASRARLVWHRFRASASLSYAAIVSEHWYYVCVGRPLHMKSGICSCRGMILVTTRQLKKRLVTDHGVHSTALATRIDPPSLVL